MTNRYVALLRGINVGGTRRVPMAELRQLFAECGYTEIATYINSGNVVFSAAAFPDPRQIEEHLKKWFGFEIEVLVLSGEQIHAIAQAIPREWQNDKEQRSDVAYLFPAFNTPESLNTFRHSSAIETILYVDHALLINVHRSVQSRSSLLRIMGTPFYRGMTIRNVNTARKLAEMI